MDASSLSTGAIGQITLTIHQLAESLGCAIDLKDSYTQNHSMDVAAMARAIAKAMGLEADSCEMIDIAGHLHDIGKIGISDAVLKNRGSFRMNSGWKCANIPFLVMRSLKTLKG